MDRGADYQESNRGAQAVTSTWSSGNVVPLHQDTLRGGGLSGDGQVHHHERHQRRHNFNHSNHIHFNNSITEPNNRIGSGGDGSSSHSFPFPGRKRQFSNPGQGTPPDYIDAGNFVKLYVGAIPRTATEEDIRSVFERHGKIIEVVLLKDKRTGQPQECCFVKYATLQEADQAIGTLHNQYIFPGGVAPIRVKFADGERERLGALGEHIYKLYVGCLNKQASKMEIEQIFSSYGRIEDVFIVRDELMQNRGCAFVQFSLREMAIAAINALNGIYVMRGCDQPLIVRFADPKKPKFGESRCNSKFVAPGIVPCSEEAEFRQEPYPRTPINGQKFPIASNQASPRRSPCAGTESQAASTNSALKPVCRPSYPFAHAVLVNAEDEDFLDCDWSEHICPDGYTYYYNCATCESRWKKPEEFAAYERKLQTEQQHPLCQQLHSLSQSADLFSLQVSQIQ